jgi:hypothetical protein
MLLLVNNSGRTPDLDNEENPMQTTATDRTQPIAPAPAGAQPGGRSGMGPMLRSMFWDVGLPVAGYYGAKAAGASDYVALMIGTVLTGVRLLWVALRDRRLDPFALFLMVIFGAGLILTFVTGDARFVLVKDSFTSGLAGLMFVGSVLVGHPLTFYAAKRFAGPGGSERLERLWATDPGARRSFITLSLAWGFGLLGEALIRLPLIYLLPVSTAVGASTALQVVVYGGLIALTMRISKRARQGATES